MAECRAAAFDLVSYLARWGEAVDRELDELLPRVAEAQASTVYQAMRYSVFAGGKRLRPALCVAGCEAVGGDPARALRTAAGLEMIHTYSLIHDDLPAMDNDDLRRGRPTCHKKFGEAAAILAGDGLLTEAFAVIGGDEDLPAELRVRLVLETARAAGVYGMVAGQAADMEKEGAAFTAADVAFIHERKTAALIAAAVAAGALIGGGTDDQVRDLREYGRSLGLAFQATDDLLNVTGGRDLGKAAGTDAARGKATYPALLGLEAAQRQAEELTEQALSALSSFDQRAAPLRELARYVVVRKK